MEICRHCGQPIRLFDDLMGPQWLHVDIYAHVANTANGTAWITCKAKTVAEPVGHL